MKTSIEKSSLVDKPIIEVWESLSDPAKIVTCIPEAKIMKKKDENHYEGEITMKFGPVSTKYGGKIVIENLDPLFTCHPTI